MVNYFIYAKDNSGSTDEVAYYHDNGLKTLEQFKSDVNQIISKLPHSEESRIIYLHWGQKCVDVSEEKCVYAYNNRDGRGGGTSPETIIRWIKKNIDYKCSDKIKLVYIITDGQIFQQSQSQCLLLNKDVDYEDVIFHAFNTNLEEIDLSVTASFIKRSCSIYRNNELLDKTDISEVFDYSKITVDNFNTERDSLKSYIRLKYLNSLSNNVTALVEIDKLKSLRNRLFSSLTSYVETIPDTSDKLAFIDTFKKTKWYRLFRDPVNNSKTEIEKSISTLINYIVSEKKSYSFNALKFDVAFHVDFPEEPIDVNFTENQEIEFPDIILADEKGIPVILLMKLNLLNKLIFHSTESSGSFSNFHFLMECPLFLMTDGDLSESIGYFYTLNVYKELLNSGTTTDPNTRRPFHGGLVLVETEEFDKYNDYILSATYFNSKKIKYNIGLFYYILWKFCTTKKWMDVNVTERFRKYMLRRVCNTQCKIALSSLPLDPQINTSLPMALWYCVEISSDLFKNDANCFLHERLRLHHSVAPSMIEILHYLNYNIDIESIKNRTELIKTVMIMKQIPRLKDKYYFLLEKVFKKVNGFLIAEIENPQNIKKLNYLKLNSKEMLNDDVTMQEVDLNDYVHFMHHVDHDKEKVTICKQTLRPYFTINQYDSFYSELYNCTKQVVVSNVDGEIVLRYDAIDHLDFGKILSAYNLYLRCVKDNKKFPILDEYSQYIGKKKRFNEDLITIFPVDINRVIEDVFHKYQDLVKGVSLSEFIQVTDKYVSRFDRIKVEKNEKEKYVKADIIQRFIRKEETKVNLNKNKLAHFQQKLYKPRTRPTRLTFGDFLHFS